MVSWLLAVMDKGSRDILITTDHRMLVCTLQTKKLESPQRVMTYRGYSKYPLKGFAVDVKTINQAFKQH